METGPARGRRPRRGFLRRRAAPALGPWLDALYGGLALFGGFSLLVFLLKKNLPLSFPHFIPLFLSLFYSLSFLFPFIVSL